MVYFETVLPAIDCKFNQSSKKGIILPVGRKLAEFIPVYKILISNNYAVKYS